MDNESTAHRGVSCLPSDTRCLSSGSLVMAFLARCYVISRCLFCTPSPLTYPSLSLGHHPHVVSIYPIRDSQRWPTACTQTPTHPDPTFPDPRRPITGCQLHPRPKVTIMEYSFVCSPVIRTTSTTNNHITSPVPYRTPVARRMERRWVFFLLAILPLFFAWQKATSSVDPFKHLKVTSLGRPGMV